MEKRYDYITSEDYVTAESNGIPAKLLEQRVYLSWDIDRAITEPLRISKPFQPIWKKWERVALEHGISRQLFYRRTKNNWPMLKAATHPRIIGKPLSVHWTDEEREIARQNGLDANYMNIIKTRIRNGWTREEALHTPKISEKERAKRVAEGTRRYHRKRGVNREFNKTI